MQDRLQKRTNQAWYGIWFLNSVILCKQALYLLEFYICKNVGPISNISEHEWPVVMFFLMLSRAVFRSKFPSIRIHYIIPSLYLYSLPKREPVKPAKPLSLPYQCWVFISVDFSDITYFMNFPVGSFVFWTHLMPLISCDNSWKHQKTRGFLTFSGVSKEISGIKWVKANSKIYDRWW